MKVLFFSLCVLAVMAMLLPSDGECTAVDVASSRVKRWQVTFNGGGGGRGGGRRRGGRRRGKRDLTDESEDVYSDALLAADVDHDGLTSFTEALAYTGLPQERVKRFLETLDLADGFLEPIYDD